MKELLVTTAITLALCVTCNQFGCYDHLTETRYIIVSKEGKVLDEWYDDTIDIEFKNGRLVATKMWGSVVKVYSGDASDYTIKYIRK